MLSVYTLSMNNTAAEKAHLTAALKSAIANPMDHEEVPYLFTQLMFEGANTTDMRGVSDTGLDTETLQACVSVMPRGRLRDQIIDYLIG